MGRRWAGWGCRGLVAGALAGGLIPGAVAEVSTLERVKAAKVLVCGVNTEEGDYSRTDDHGAREAFDRDLCRAVAVAILGAEAKVVVRPVPDDSTGVEALLAGAIDLLPTHTLDFSHATKTGVGFSGVVLWDGVGFLVPLGSEAQRAGKAELLSGKKVCVLDGTEAEETLAGWFRRKGLVANPFPYQEEGEMEAGFVTGGCAAIAGDWTRLASIRRAFPGGPARYKIIGEMISRDPLAAAYRRETDARFGEIVDWLVQVLIGAEEGGVTALSVGTLAARGEPESKAEQEMEMLVRRLTGRTHELGDRLGLADDWAVQAIGAVGNYGEMFERDLGPGSAMGLERGWNRLQRDGGVMAGLPLK